VASKIIGGKIMGRDLSAADRMSLFFMILPPMILP